MSVFITKPVTVRAEFIDGCWHVFSDNDPQGSHNDGLWNDGEFQKVFEPHEKQARRDMQRRREHAIIVSQRRELRRMNRVISVLKSRYLTIFGEIDRALGEDLPRNRSASYQAGFAEGRREGFAHGYDVAKGGEQ